MLQHLITQDADLRMVPVDHAELTTAVNDLREELRSLPDGADPARTRVLSRWIGIGQLSLGDPHGALAFLRQSLDLATAGGDSRAVVATELNLGDAHRYAGETESAAAFYRRALDTARSEQPELIDFALQHYGKHLMEQGDLPHASAHLREALRLRITKGDTGLIESTQAALDRVERLLADAAVPAADLGAPDQWSSRWTSWLLSHTCAAASARWNDDFPAIRDAVRSLVTHQRVQPCHLRDQPFAADLVAALAQEAEKALTADGYLHNGKRNAPVGDTASTFAAQADLAAVVARATGLDVEQPHTGVYIAYGAGQFLDFHVDDPGFGEANLILCLRHDRPAATTASSTVFITADGYLECDLAPGDCVVFDGARTPHGRTPLGSGESVVLISFGFRERAGARSSRSPLGEAPSAPRE
ncbi:tetratricopeptide repeat protein [Kitasatospora sp. NPDC088548]|uniref:tetratricopeptide repeat protein n=1 Tax=Kitasatospora sp. NPDC088548 TaxID=3364075 RepID=UPI00380FC991